VNNIIISITSTENLALVEIKIGSDYSATKQIYRNKAVFPFRAIVKCLLKIAKAKYRKWKKNFDLAERIARL